MSLFEIRRVTNTSKGESVHAGYVLADDIDEARELASPRYVEIGRSFFTIPTTVGTQEQARTIAIDWQAQSSQESLSMGELAEWQGFFEELATRFNLTEEFRENAII